MLLVGIFSVSGIIGKLAYELLWKKISQTVVERKGDFFSGETSCSLLCLLLSLLLVMRCFVAVVLLTPYRIISDNNMATSPQIFYEWHGMSMRNSHKQFRGHHQPTTTAPLTPSRHIKILTFYIFYWDSIQTSTPQVLSIITGNKRSTLYNRFFSSYMPFLQMYKITLGYVFRKSEESILSVALLLSLNPIEGSKRNHFCFIKDNINFFLSGKNIWDHWNGVAIINNWYCDF